METSVSRALISVFSCADTVGPTGTDPDPGWAGRAGAGPAGPDPADHHPAAPDGRHCWPDAGNATVSPRRPQEHGCFGRVRTG